MNNFKKLLASAMALTMVTSVVPAVSTNVNAALLEGVCDANTFTSINPLLTLILDKDTDLESMEFAATDVPETDYKVSDYLDEGGLDLLEKAIDCADESQVERVEYLYNAGTLYFNYVNYRVADITITDFESYVEATTALQSLESLYYDFGGNLTNKQRDSVLTKINNLTRKIDNAGFDTTDTLKAYTEELKEKIEEFVKKETQNETSNLRNSITKTELTSFIKEIKADAKYKAFADEDPVIDIMEELDSWYDEIETVSAAINTRSNDAYKAMLDLQKSTTRDYAGNKVVTYLTMEDWEVYKEFKEEVIDVIYTMETEKFASKYYDASSKSNFATIAEVNKLLGLFGDEEVDIEKNTLTYLVELQDAKNGLFGWDVLEAHMEAVIEAYELIDVELDKLVAKNLTVNDKDMILALDDAYDYLTNEGKDNLTSAEAKEVRRAERTIDELYEAYRVKFGSLAETTGWVDMGNGDWKYFEADGTAPTKWICTAPNTWYYVQNGVMLRNAWVWRDATSAYYVGDDGKMLYGPATTPDGYAIDANGLWHA